MESTQAKTIIMVYLGKLKWIQLKFVSDRLRKYSSMDIEDSPGSR